MEESHPVPQNVTSFEFHLVGDMTLKQFTYLAAGLGIAYLTFIFLAKPAPLVAWPIILISALFGVSFAFLPIGERPLDHWASAFIRAIFKPTLRRYKSKVISKEAPEYKNRLQIYLNTLPVAAPASLTTIGQSSIPVTSPQTTPSRPNQTTPITPPQPVPPQIPQAASPQPVNPAPQPTPQPHPAPKIEEQLPSPNELKKAVGLAKEAQAVQSKIVDDERKLEDIKRRAAEPGANPNNFTKQFENVLSDLQELNKQASNVSKDLAVLSKAPSPAPSPVTKAPVQIIPSLSLTSIPNIINGIITDSQGNYLESAIIVAHDAKGLPVRALKSNKLGQFITATPLPDGEYTLSAEKDALAFPTYQVELKGEVMQPIVIAAQKGGVV